MWFLTGTHTVYATIYYNIQTILETALLEILRHILFFVSQRSHNQNRLKNERSVNIKRKPEFKYADED